MESPENTGGAAAEKAPGVPPVPRRVTPLRPFFWGVLMGAADAVPGVSGGTMALILGIYERFIEAVSTVLRLPSAIRSEAGRRALGGSLRLLVPLVAGLLLAYLAATWLLVGPDDRVGLLQDAGSARLCYAFFFGLVLASLGEPWRRIRIQKLSRFALALAGALAAFLVAGLDATRSEPETWMFLYGGALAIAVMLLPGISGSLLLVVLNQYIPLTSAVHNRALGPVGVFLAGIVLGLLLFVPCLRALLRRVHDPTMAVLTGLMAGSLRALWPWKANYDLKQGALINVGVGDGLAGVVVAAILGAVVILALGRIERGIRGGAG